MQTLQGSKHDHASRVLPGFEVGKGLRRLVDRVAARDQLVELELAAHVKLEQPREVVALHKTGRKTSVLHTFYRLDDGSHLAFFEAPDMPFEFKDQHDFDLHIALEVERGVLEPMMAKGKANGIETRGISNHGFIDSIYFCDPNGYAIELCAKRERHDEEMDPARNGARAISPARGGSRRRPCARPSAPGRWRA